MIPVQELLNEFEVMLMQRWPYVWGAAQKGCVDCSGAFVYAYKKHGHSIYHGSNRMARVEVKELLPMAMARPGMAAFKKRPPEHAKYTLPAAYKKGGAYYNGDLNDYYHVGLVDVDGTILNAQSSSTGFVRSKADTWDACGWLVQVDYGEPEGVGGAAPRVGRVTAKSGSTVNLRENRSVQSFLVYRVPVGSTVELDGDVYGGWYAVRWKGYKGYMKAEFVEVV